MKLISIPVEERLTELFYDIKLSPILNFLFGHHARFPLDKIVIDCLKKRNLTIRKNSGFTFFTFLHTAMLDEGVLDSINSFGCYHDTFGEGFDDKERKNKGDTFKSYLFQIENSERYVHIGFDHRGTSVSFPIDMSEQEFTEFVEWVIDVCYKYDKELFMKYFNLCNK